MKNLLPRPNFYLFFVILQSIMDKKRQGLSAVEVLISREEHGENVLTPPKRTSMWRLYLEKYEDPMVRILLVAAVVSLILAFSRSSFSGM